MKKMHKFLLLMVIMVFVPVCAIWYTAWPLVTAWELPEIENAYLNTLAEKPLSKEYVSKLNQWLYSHRTGWGTKGEKPPESKENIHLILEYNHAHMPHYFSLFFWHFRHGDDVIAIQRDPHGAYRMRSLDIKESEDFRRMMAQ